MSFDSLKFGLIFNFVLSNLYNESSLKLIFFKLYTSIIFSSIIAFSSSSNSPKIKLKNPINLVILVAKYPFSVSSRLSSLISNTLI